MARKGNATIAQLVPGPSMLIPSAYTVAFFMLHPASPVTNLSAPNHVFVVTSAAGFISFSYDTDAANAAFVSSFLQAIVGGTFPKLSFPASSFNGGQWYHMAATFDGVNYLGYRNGVLEISTTTVAGLAGVGETGSPTLLNYANARFSPAAVAEFGLWPVVLTPGEILALAQGAPVQTVRRDKKAWTVSLREDEGAIFDPGAGVSPSLTTQYPHPAPRRLPLGSKL